jgi:phosphoribosylformylglycinamidine synthase
LLVDLVGRGLVESLHDCAEGGFAVTLAECCFGNGGVGVRVDVAPAPSDGGVDQLASTLFGESASRAIASAAPRNSEAVLAAARHAGIPAMCVGRTGGPRFQVAVGGRGLIDVTVAEAEHRWANALAECLEGPAA